MRERARQTILVLTIGAMFLLLHNLLPWLETLQVVKDTPAAGKAILSALTSVGIYRTMVLGLDWVLKKWAAARHLFLGRGLLEGTWVGSGIRTDGLWFLVLEQYEQGSDGVIRIRGESYYPDDHDNPRSFREGSTWTSDNVVFDLDSGSLNYAYRCHDSDGSLYEGVSKFLIQRKTVLSAPTAMKGYAADAGSNDHAVVCEVKARAFGYDHSDRDKLLEEALAAHKKRPAKLLADPGPKLFPVPKEEGRAVPGGPPAGADAKKAEDDPGVAEDKVSVG